MEPDAESCGAPFGRASNAAVVFEAKAAMDALATSPLRTCFGERTHAEEKAARAAGRCPGLFARSDCNKCRTPVDRAPNGSVA
mmetsp:Transcript_107298/g.256182  ORF Transcript_107298/g.256182 Transcript_107298/m.256182 type:complete len:83 (-) Transcript_107298:1308-1556(-)